MGFCKVPVEVRQFCYVLAPRLGDEGHVLPGLGSLLLPPLGVL